MRSFPTDAVPPEVAADAAAGTETRSDEALMLAYRGGELVAFERLFARHERPVYRFLLRSVSIPALAEDLLQETWLSVARGAATWEPRALFTTWLYRIARSRLVDHWRRGDSALLARLDGEDGELACENLPAPASLEPERATMDRAQARAFVLAVEALPPAQREAFLLHAEAGLAIAQIAAITGVPPETTKSRFRYACAKLRESMQEWRSR